MRGFLLFACYTKCGHVCIQVEEIELKPGGGDIDVTESNKKEYVQ